MLVFSSKNLNKLVLQHENKILTVADAHGL